jgi:hypothetical protein
VGAKRKKKKRTLALIFGDMASKNYWHVIKIIFGFCGPYRGPMLSA